MCKLKLWILFLHINLHISCRFKQNYIVKNALYLLVSWSSILEAHFQSIVLLKHG